jgi:hypothetical protein
MDQREWIHLRHRDAPVARPPRGRRVPDRPAQQPAGGVPAQKGGHQAGGGGVSHAAQLKIES